MNLVESVGVPRASDAKTADVLKVMREGKKYIEAGPSSSFYENRKQSPYRGLSFRSSPQDISSSPFHSTPIRKLSEEAKAGVVKPVRVSNHQDSSAATHHLMSRPEPLSRTIDLSSGEGSGVGKDVLQRVKEVRVTAAHGRGLAGVMARKKY